MRPKNPDSNRIRHVTKAEARSSASGTNASPQAQSCAPLQEHYAGYKQFRQREAQGCVILPNNLRKSSLGLGSRQSYTLDCPHNMCGGDGRGVAAIDSKIRVEPDCRKKHGQNPGLWIPGMDRGQE